ncbi:hypothetical protein [Streptomyces sp. NBC_00354]|uniref:hypothetical protein n=1 Tax=Streptomyces sp. NBC_00354 TaxID=2975723 RepID=UPI002E26E06B
MRTPPKFTDLAYLARSALHCGLYRLSTRLYRRAVLAGDTHAAHQLVVQLNLLGRDPHGTGAFWAAEHVSLADPEGVAELLLTLRSAPPAREALLRRRPARHVRLDDPHGLSRLVDELRRCQAQDAIAELPERAPAEHVRLDYASGVAWLLDALKDARAYGAARVLAGRPPTAFLSTTPAESRDCSIQWAVRGARKTEPYC